MEYKILAFIALLSLSASVPSFAPPEAWETDFAVAIARLRDGIWEPHVIKERHFEKQAERLWEHIKKHRDDWEPILELSPQGRHADNMLKPPQKTLEELFTAREALAKKPYIENVMQSKRNTLILETTKFPNLILKIDGRPTSDFDEIFRSYFSAFQKTNQVRKWLMFSHLYLPLEKGRLSKQIRAHVVISEKIPFFSESELDNRILLHLMLKEFQKDLELSKRMKRMYMQMISYICRVNFGDVNYRNVPFAVDGRLSPFDTDTFLADTGVVSFLKQFFAYRVLPRETIETIVDERCNESANIKAEIDNYYQELNVYEKMIRDNDQIIAAMVHFFQTREANFTSFRSLIHREIIPLSEKRYARALDAQIKRKLTTKARTEFGMRCDHISDFILGPILAIKSRARALGDEANPNDRSREAIAQKLYELIQRAVDNGEMYAAGPVNYNLGRHKDLRAFICF